MGVWWPVLVLKSVYVGYQSYDYYWYSRNDLHGTHLDSSVGASRQTMVLSSAAIHIKRGPVGLLTVCVANTWTVLKPCSIVFILSPILRFKLLKQKKHVEKWNTSYFFIMVSQHFYTNNSLGLILIYFKFHLEFIRSLFKIKVIKVSFFITLF